MAASTKMSVDISAFKQGMQEATARVKTLDAEMKKAEAQFRSTGDAETYMTQKAETLQQKIKAQKDAVANLEKALQAMKDNGVSETSSQYQKLAERLATAQAAMIETTTELNNLGQSEQEAARGADQLTQSVNGIGKKISLDQVISGINTITGGMEKAAGKAVDLGKALWENITDSARWADDTATQAMILNMDVETYQQYKQVLDTVGELTVQEWQKAKMKVQKAINDPTQDQTDILNLLGINTHEILQGKNGAIQGAARDFEDVFWEIGETLRAKVASGEMTQDLADTYTRALFGPSFANLNPMFALGKEGFAAALEEQNVVTGETVNKMGELNDKLIKLNRDYENLKAEVLGGLAPALQGAAEVLDSLLGRLMEYLQTDEGKQALEDMGKAVEGLFSDLGKIDPEQVVEGFSKVFGDIVSGITWLDENKETLKNVLTVIVGGWGAAKLTGGVLQLKKLVDGIMGLAGGTGAAQAAGRAAGSAWGTGVANGIMSAAPWLLGLYTLLKPGDTGNNDIVDKNGNLTAEAEAYGYKKDQNGEVYQDRTAVVEKAAQDAWDLYRTNSFDKAAMEQLRSTILNDNAFQQLVQQMYGASGAAGWRGVEDLDLSEWIKQFGAPEVEVDPVAPEDAAAQISEQIGTVAVPVVMVPTSGEGTGRIRTPRGWITPDGSHVNGLPFAPFDGYIAELHRGERIVPARENVSRNFSSNLYIESMYMNNGTDAQALAQSIAAANRRSMAGYGS